jgi:DUF1009 family protein
LKKFITPKFDTGSEYSFRYAVMVSDTIEDLVDNGCKYLIVESDEVIINDKPETLALAYKLGITILGKY